MKIAILTLPLHTNYGGILQAYALQTVLERMGHEVEVLQQAAFQVHSEWLMPLVYAKRFAYRLLGNKNIEFFSEIRHKRERPIIERNTSKFIEQYIHLRFIKSFSDISQNDYDAIVVGSDQIWRKLYFRSRRSKISNAFLDFTEGWNIKRVAYAASFGLDNINEYTQRDVETCRKSLQRFYAVSVREDSGVEICNDAFGVNARHLIDPTMLLDKNDYETLVSQSNIQKSDGDMMCYILDQTHFKKKIISSIAQSYGLKPFRVNADVDNYYIPVEERVQPPIESWLRGFMDANFVVTDSYHACVFSIIFNKPFIVIGNTDRGMGRFTSLLTSFGMEDRLIIDLENIDVSQRLKMHLCDVSDVLKEKRELAFNFLDSINR